MARTSRRVQTLSSRRHIIGRLTGLDPFNLGLISGITIGILSSADAQWVESIHTEGSGSRGDLNSRGHVSYFVNGGVSQPMCTQTLPNARWDCSHIFALSIWAESVRAITAVFPALQCESWSQYLAGDCNMNEIANMGRSNAVHSLRGTYFLATNLQAPWSRPSPYP